MSWFVVSLLWSAADAHIYTGNPIIDVVARQSGGGPLVSAIGDVDAFEVEYCDGSVYTETVAAATDLSVTYTFSAPSGYICGVNLLFDSDIAVVGTNGAGPFTGDIGDDILEMVWSGNPIVGVVSDWTNTSGSASNPEFHVDIN